MDPGDRSRSGRPQGLGDHHAVRAPDENHGESELLQILDWAARARSTPEAKGELFLTDSSSIATGSQSRRSARCFSTISPIARTLATTRRSRTGCGRRQVEEARRAAGGVRRHTTCSPPRTSCPYRSSGGGNGSAGDGLLRRRSSHRRVEVGRERTVRRTSRRGIDRWFDRGDVTSIGRRGKYIVCSSTPGSR